MKTSMMKVWVCSLFGAVVFLGGCAVEKPKEFGSVATNIVTTTTTKAATTTTVLPVNPDIGKVVEQDFIVNVAGIDVRLLDNPAALLAELGEPERTEEKTAGGYWIDHTKSYYYSSIWVRMGVDTDGTEKIDALFIRDNSVILNKGIAIGCTREDLMAAYGALEEADVDEDGTFIQYHLAVGNVTYTLFFSFEDAKDNTVDYIQIQSNYFQF